MMFKLDITSSLFFCVLVICRMFLLKLAITAFTSLYFRTLWRNWLIFFLLFKKSLVYDRKTTENNLASSWSSGTRWAKCRTGVRRHRHQTTGVPNNRGTKQQGCQRADVEKNTSSSQRWPESLFQTPNPLLFQNFWIRVLLFFKFENTTAVQTPATIIVPTVIYTCSYLRNDHTDSCQCRNGKVTPDPGPVFHKFLTPDGGPNEKRRFLRGRLR